MKSRNLVAIGVLIGCAILGARVSAQGLLPPSQAPIAPTTPAPVVPAPTTPAPVAPALVAPTAPPAATPFVAPTPVAPVEATPQPQPVQVQADLSPQAAATTTLAPAPAATTVESSSSGDSGPPSEFMRDLFFGPVGATLGNAVYRGTFYELGYSYEATPWLGAGAALSGIVFHENRGAIFNSFLAVAGGASAAASRRDSVYAGSDDTYDYYRGLTAEEQANEDARVAGMMDNAASIATDRPLSMTAHLWHESLGSSMNGGQIDFTWAIWIDAWSRGIVIEPGLGFAYAELHHDSGSKVHGGKGGTYGWFGPELDLRIPILPFLGIVSHGTLGVSGDKALTLSVGLEATLGNRFVARGSLQTGSIKIHKNDDRITGTGLQLELGVRL